MFFAKILIFAERHGIDRVFFDVFYLFSFFFNIRLIWYCLLTRGMGRAS